MVNEIKFDYVYEIPDGLGSSKKVQVTENVSSVLPEQFLSIRKANNKFSSNRFAASEVVSRAWFKAVAKESERIEKEKPVYKMRVYGDFLDYVPAAPFFRVNPIPVNPVVEINAVLPPAIPAERINIVVEAEDPRPNFPPENWGYLEA